VKKVAFFYAQLFRFRFFLLYYTWAIGGSAAEGYFRIFQKTMFRYFGIDIINRKNGKNHSDTGNGGKANEGGKPPGATS